MANLVFYPHVVGANMLTPAPGQPGAPGAPGGVTLGAPGGPVVTLAASTVALTLRPSAESDLVHWQTGLFNLCLLCIL